MPGAHASNLRIFVQETNHARKRRRKNYRIAVEQQDVSPPCFLKSNVVPDGKASVFRQTNQAYLLPGFAHQLNTPIRRAIVDNHRLKGDVAAFAIQCLESLL